MTSKVLQGSFVDGRPHLLGSVVQTKAMPGPPAPASLARPPVVQRRGASDPFPVDYGKLGLMGGGKPLPDALRGKMEAALGADFRNVRVHEGPQAERVGAAAFTVGSDIYFAPGRFQPNTLHGQQLLGHELAHVIQQRSGKVRNPFGSGLAVVRDRMLEAEADHLARRAAAYRVEAPAKTASGAVQRSAVDRRPMELELGRIRRTISSVVQRAEKKPELPSFTHLNYNKKSYRDKNGKPVTSPGNAGYVCARTPDGKYDVCKYYTRYFFETMNTLSAPGQTSTLDYSRPMNLQGDPSIKTGTQGVNPSNFYVFENEDK